MKQAQERNYRYQKWWKGSFPWMSFMARKWSKESPSWHIPQEMRWNNLQPVWSMQPAHSPQELHRELWGEQEKRTGYICTHVRLICNPEHVRTYTGANTTDGQTHIHMYVPTYVRIILHYVHTYLSIIPHIPTYNAPLSTPSNVAASHVLWHKVI
jgi:hypothetical protein